MNTRKKVLTLRLNANNSGPDVQNTRSLEKQKVKLQEEPLPTPEKEGLRNEGRDWIKLNESLQKNLHWETPLKQSCSDLGPRILEKDQAFEEIEELKKSRFHSVVLSQETIEAQLQQHRERLKVFNDFIVPFKSTSSKEVSSDESQPPPPPQEPELQEIKLDEKKEIEGTAFRYILTFRNPSNSGKKRNIIGLLGVYGKIGRSKKHNYVKHGKRTTRDKRKSKICTSEVKTFHQWSISSRRRFTSHQKKANYESCRIESKVNGFSINYKGV